MKKTTSLRHSIAAVVAAVSIGLGFGTLSVAEAQAAGVDTSSTVVVEQVALPVTTVRDEQHV